MSSLTDLSLKEMQIGLRDGQFSSRELVSSALEQIEKFDPNLHAFLHLATESSLKQADKADSVGVQDAPLLQGIPIAIKDVLTVEGMPATAGSKVIEGFIPPYTATAVTKLQQAGAILIGKTNGLFDRKFSLWHDIQSLGYIPRARRLLRRIGSSSCSAASPDGTGD